MVGRPLVCLALIAWLFGQVGLLGLLGLGVLELKPATTQKSPATTVHPLQPGAWIFGSTCVDLDGDGRQEVILQIVKDNRRQLAVFRQTDRGFQSTPDQLLPIPEKAIFYMAGPLGPEDERGVLLIGHRATWFHPWHEGTLESEGQTLFKPELYPSTADPRFCYAWRIHEDLDGDGRADLLLPEWVPGEHAGYRVFSRRMDENYAPGVGLKALIQREYAPRPGGVGRFRTSLPMPVLADMNGDRRRDLTCLVGSTLKTFCQVEGKGVRPDPWAETPLRFFRPSPAGQVTLDRLALEDLNGDGRADLMYMRKHGRVGLFGSLRTRIEIYLAPFLKKGRPDQILNLTGLTKRPRFLDFDGDGDLDVILSTLKMDAFSAIRRVVGGDVPAVFRIHRFDAKRNRYESAPVAEVERGLPFDKLLDYSPVPFVFLHGDFNGDGRFDRLEAVDTDRVEARAGRFTDAGGYAYDDAPLFSVAVSYSDNLYLTDLSGEGCTDILSHAGDRATVVLCR
jgi:hypothetical protein